MEHILDGTSVYNAHVCAMSSFPTKLDISEGLAQTQKEKLASLAEGVEFVSEESYREKIVTIKENYFPKTQASSSEDLVTETQVIAEEGPMAAYAAALSKWSK